MDIVSHRGYWIDHTEKNSETALIRALNNGFGIETDIRDYQGQLCISHDLPKKQPLLLTQLLSIFGKYDTKPPIFLNIKSDDLYSPLKKMLDEFSIQNYFTFDMAVPEMVQYHKNTLTFLTRMSDIETTPVFIEAAKGIWVDNFFNQTLNPENINHFIDNDNCILVFVSPELHGRPYNSYWQHLKEWEDKKAFNTSNLFLCTDYPKLAQTYFNKGSHS